MLRDMTALVVEMFVDPLWIPDLWALCSGAAGVEYLVIYGISNTSKDHRRREDPCRGLPRSALSYAIGPGNVTVNKFSTNGRAL